MLPSGGYVNTDNLPLLSGYWEKIEELKKQLEMIGTTENTKPEQPKSSLEELTELYVNSLDNPQDDAWNAAVSENSQTNSTKPVGSTFSNDVVNRSGETAGENSQLETEKESGDSTSPIIPIAGGLYYNTETGEYIDNYNYKGNEGTADESNGNTGQNSEPEGVTTTNTPGAHGGDTTKPFVPTMTEPIPEYSQPEIPVGSTFMDDVVNRSGANGQTGTQSSGAGDYYINPDDYDSDEDYAKDLLKQYFYLNKDGNGDMVLTNNGYETGVAGKVALFDYVRDTIGDKDFFAYWSDMDKEGEKEDCTITACEGIGRSA